MISYLGGVCTKCGTNENLHIDHIDSNTKSFDISSNWGIKWEKLQKELDKCQLLCQKHHIEKSRTHKDHAGGHNKWKEIKHGTVWAYSKYKCRCDLCKQAKSEERKKSYLKEKAKKNNGA